jgi:hypothetical protein
VVQSADTLERPGDPASWIAGAVQEAGEVGDQFPWDVEHGTIGDHVESFTVDVDLQRDLFYRGLHACFRTWRSVCVSV